MELKNDSASKEMTSQKTTMESLSKEEIVSKYKGLLNIAKKAKQAKDELTEENRKLKEALSGSETQKEADKKALLTMKEMLEQFTNNKLQLVTQLNEIQTKHNDVAERNAQLQIENESFQRQLARLTEENDALLIGIDRMEEQKKQINVQGQKQKQHLELLEVNIEKLKDAECQNDELKQQIIRSQEESQATLEELDQLRAKYDNVKAINSEQRKKFNSLKDRFIDVHRKLKNLKQCKCVLLETQHEYADSVSKWQGEIIKASQLLCGKLNALQQENAQLRAQLVVEEPKTTAARDSMVKQLSEVERLCAIVCQEQLQQQLEQERLTQELHDIKTAHVDTEAKLRSVQVENEQLKGNKINLVDARDETTHKKNVLDQTAQVEELTEKLTENNVKLSKFYKENEALQALMTQSEQQLRQLQTERSLLEVKAEESSSQIAELTSKWETQVECLQTENTKLKQNIEDLQSKCTKLETEAESLKQIGFEVQLQSLLAEKQELNTQLTNLKGTTYETQEQLKSIETSHSELLKRFEEAKYHHGETHLKYVQLLQINEKLQDRYELKEREHAELLDEMRELNEALKGRGDYISRQEEKQQEMMQELRNTLQKLSEVELALEAAKQTTEQLSKAQNKLTELETELHTLRSQESNIDAQSDVLSTSTISRAEELSRLRELDDNYEEKYHKLRGLAAKLKKKLQDQNICVSQMEQQLSSTAAAKKELEEEKLELVKMEQELATLKSENQKLKSTRKQSNMLNLEIEAAEKSLADVSAKLTAKSDELSAVRETLITKENSNVQLRKQIGILEAAKDAEVKHAKELKEQIDRMQTQVKDAVHAQQQALTNSKELEQTIEKHKLELEEVHLQLAVSASKHEASLAQAKLLQDTLAAKLQSAEEKVALMEVTLKHSERACDDLRVEYLDYKVKAQAVLRKNQSKETCRERELEDELTALRASELELQANAQSQIGRVVQMEKQMELLQEDNESLQRRGRELLILVEELRQQNETLGKENQRSQHLRQEELLTHCQQMENMETCYKTQLHQVQQQLAEAQAQLVKVTRKPTTIGAVAASTLNSNDKSNLIHTSATMQPNSGSPNQISTEQNKIDFLLMEREAAEGSEEAVESLAHLAAKRKISTTSRRSQHEFIPLDELLNTPLTAISDKVVTARSLARSNSSVHDVEDDFIEQNALVTLQATKERLQIQESRVRHLTALLAENEQDLAKLTQMNDMLKEELRRQQRSEEREQHMHNSEYLKNVFLKFLTLNNGEERMRLVPVLNTILTLSRHETEILCCVAKGQKLSHPDSGNRGWGSFLASWGSGGGNNNA